MQLRELSPVPCDGREGRVGAVRRRCEREGDIYMIYICISHI